MVRPGTEDNLPSFPPFAGRRKNYSRGGGTFSRPAPADRPQGPPASRPRPQPPSGSGGQRLTWITVAGGKPLKCVLLAAE